MIKCRRRNYQLGGSKAMTYPSGVMVGGEASVAGDRLLLVDPRGEIDENDLLEFMENNVEPMFWKWWRQKEALKRTSGRDVMTAIQAQGSGTEEIEAVEVRDVAAGPQVFLVNCWHCGGQIAWRAELGLHGCCPYCGALIQLVI